MNCKTCNTKMQARGGGYLFCPTCRTFEIVEIEEPDTGPIIFADGRCPKCGRMCGNGGHGPLRCRCGWVGEIDLRDIEMAEAFIDEVRKQSDEIRSKPCSNLTDN